MLARRSPSCGSVIAKDNNSPRINTGYVARPLRFLTLLDTLSTHSHNGNSSHADVAELADAQVSEACDGDIVEVQVLSSPPFHLL